MTSLDDAICQSSDAFPAEGTLNTVTLDFANWALENGPHGDRFLDPDSRSTHVASDDWSLTFSGPSASFLNRDLAPALGSAAGATLVAHITESGEYDVDLTPADPTRDISLFILDWPGPIPALDENGYPVFETLTLSNVWVYLVDESSGLGRCQMEDREATLEIVYRGCTRE